MNVDHAARRARIRDRLPGLGLDALYVTNLVDVRWLTGFAGTNGQVVVTADGRDLFVTDGRYVEQARETVDVETRQAKGRQTGVDDVVEGLDRIGVQADQLTWARADELRTTWEGTEVVAVTGVLAEERQVKDEHELATLRRACAITDDAWTWLLGELRAGRTERDVAVALERRLVDLGADGRAFQSIVASGPNSARPHHRPTARVIQPGDVVKVDFGALVDGYHADMTRVAAVGTPPAKLVEVHREVQAAQAGGVEAATVGATTGAVDRACRQHLAQAGLADHFVHGTGHGVGLDIHELPAVAEGATATLAAGMTITVEPGVYLPGIGGVRIEDTIVVTASGPERLTRSPRDLVVV